MDGTHREPFLLTPGPLTTTRATKEAMLRDWGSRDGEFIAMNARVRRACSSWSRATAATCACRSRAAGRSSWRR